jgi:1-deoxy-D-xylulose-5-phosphate reductoisomerase
VISAAPDRFEVHAVTAQFKRREARRDRSPAAGPPGGGRQRGGPGGTAGRLIGSGISASSGAEAVEEARGGPVDMVLSASSALPDCAPRRLPIRSGSDIALANKECLICAGTAFMALAREHAVNVLPVDSEHNALFQLIEGGTGRT